jgi:hypothetical protein
VEIKKMPKADIEMGYEGDRLVQITIRPTTDDDDGQLTYEELVYAARQIQDFARHEYRMPAVTRSRTTPDAVQAMVNAYNEGAGRVSDEYLAHLAVAYGDLAPERRDVSTALAVALGKPVQTIKGHIMRARREGFLTEAAEGREGGEATGKARKLIASLTPNSGKPQPGTPESEAETWRKIAQEQAEELDKLKTAVSTEESARA